MKELIRLHIVDRQDTDAGLLWDKNHKATWLRLPKASIGHDNIYTTRLNKETLRASYDLRTSCVWSSYTRTLQDHNM